MSKGHWSVSHPYVSENNYVICVRSKTKVKEGCLKMFRPSKGKGNFQNYEMSDPIQSNVRIEYIDEVGLSQWKNEVNFLAVC